MSCFFSFLVHLIDWVQAFLNSHGLSVWFIKTMPLERFSIWFIAYKITIFSLVYGYIQLVKLYGKTIVSKMEFCKLNDCGEQTKGTRIQTKCLHYCQKYDVNCYADRRWWTGLREYWMCLFFSFFMCWLSLSMIVRKPQPKWF